MRGIGGHHRGFKGATDVWLTPPSIIAALGPFDLDPCCPEGMPWETAGLMLTPKENGLGYPWKGRVWLNPPYGPETAAWLERMAQHGNGIALIFARTETAMFHRFVWKRAQGLLFIKGRLHFHDVTGKMAEANAGGPSVLIAYGQCNAVRLQESGIVGAFVPAIVNVG